MKKLIAAVLALSLGLGMSTTVFAAKHMSEALTKACKDKKPGDKVKVDGKEMKCPKPKK
jgi:hypothetical protein